jgi:very-short-patch-repair endonuclease
VVEVDGSQHLEEDHVQEDAQRDTYLASQGLLVLRFNNLQVLQELDAVVAVIFQQLMNQLGENSPSLPEIPPSPLCKGGMGGFAPTVV